MSLGHIYLCCDDGRVYTCDFIDGGDWKISLEEFQLDELWIPAKPRPKGATRNAPRPQRPPDEIIREYGLPIAGTTFISHQHRGWKPCVEYAVYAIDWQAGVPFPRRLLPEDRQPKEFRNLGVGTYQCMTPAIRKRIMSGRDKVAAGEPE